MTIKTLVPYGDDVRIERRAFPESDGSFLWQVYLRCAVADPESHPVHHTATTETDVWIPVGLATTEAAARKRAEQLAIGERLN